MKKILEKPARTNNSSSLLMDIMLFLSSFSPLFLALVFRLQSLSVRLTCDFLFALGAGSFILLLNVQRHRSPTTMKLATIDDRGPDVAGYVATYLLPLLVVPEPTPGDIAAYLLVLGVVGLVYVRSNMVQINPLLYAAGKKVFWVTSVDGFHGFLISSRTPKAGMELRVVRRDRMLFELN